MIKLLPQQQKYLEAIKWLLNPNTDHMGIGKTFLIIYAAMETALENPGRPIYLFNEHGRIYYPYEKDFVDSLIKNESKFNSIRYNVHGHYVIA